MINDPLIGWHRALQRHGDVLAFEWSDVHEVPDSFALRVIDGVITVRLMSIRPLTGSGRLPSFTSWRSATYPSPFPPRGVQMPTILLDVRAFGYTACVRGLIAEAISCDPELDKA